MTPLIPPTRHAPKSPKSPGAFRTAPQLKILAFNTLKLRLNCTHDEGVNHILWHPVEPQLVLSGSIDGVVRLWDCRTGTAVRTFTGHRDCCLSLALAADGQHVLSGSDDATAKLFALVAQQ